MIVWCVGNMSATSRVCWARGMTWHMDFWVALHCSRLPTDHLGKFMASWTGKLSDMHNTCDILVTSYVDATRKSHFWACSRGCYEESATIGFRLYSSSQTSILWIVVCYQWAFYHGQLMCQPQLCIWHIGVPQTCGYYCPSQFVKKSKPFVCRGFSSVTTRKKSRVTQKISTKWRYVMGT